MVQYEKESPFILIIQYTERETAGGDIVACAQHICIETQRKLNLKNTYIVFLLQLSTSHRSLMRSSVGYHAAWTCIHIDDIRSKNLPLMNHCKEKLSLLFDVNVAQRCGIIQVIKNSIQAAMKVFNERRNMDLETISEKITLMQNYLGNENGIYVYICQIQILKTWIKSFNLIIQTKKVKQQII